MSPVGKLALIAVGMSLTLATVVAFAGERIDELLDQQALLEMFRANPGLGWLTAIGLLTADLLLPIPGPAVITALGMVYGAVLGAFLGASGLFVAAMAAYGLAALGGLRVAHWLASEGEIARFRSGFDRWGVLAMVVTRMFPIIPEVLCVLAGLVGMSMRRFLTAQAIAGIPVALLFAWIGERFIDRPEVGLGLGLAIPFALWALLRLTGLIGPEEDVQSGSSRGGSV